MKANTRRSSEKSRHILLFQRKVTTVRWMDRFIVGGNEDEGLGDRKRKTGSHVFTQ